MQSKPLTFRQLVNVFKKQAEKSADGKTVNLAGYSATRKDGFMALWDITGPSPHPEEEGMPAMPGNRIMPEGGCFTSRCAVKIMARCAAEDVVSARPLKPAR